MIKTITNVRHDGISYPSRNYKPRVGAKHDYGIIIDSPSTGSADRAVRLNLLGIKFLRRVVQMREAREVDKSGALQRMGVGWIELQFLEGLRLRTDGEGQYERAE